MSHERLEYLFTKWLDESITDREKEEFFSFIAQPANQSYVEAFVETELRRSKKEEPLPAQATDGIMEAIFQAEKNTAAIKEQEERAPVVLFYKRSWFRYAAAIFVIAGAGLLAWFQFSNPAGKLPAHTTTTPASPVTPGKYGAILTLADGRKILLDTAANGHVAQQTNMRVQKTGNEISYIVAASAAGSTPVINTISTPRGRQYAIVLADGTKVWLNAASSLRFPASFPGPTREVEVAGEAYFEVIPDKKKPFFVRSATTEVQVLGTAFNINVYEDEAAGVTTLVHGSVKLLRRPTHSNAMQAVLNKPGQQGWITNTITLREDTDLQEVLAWKNGLFHFTNAGLPAVMRQLSRWYDVDIVYKGEVPERKFEGKIQRNLDLPDMIDILERNKVHIRLEERKLIITP